MRHWLLAVTIGLALALLALPMTSAQIADLEALERELERRKEEQARQEAEARRRAEAEARRRAEAEARRRAEMLAGPRWNQFERVSDGVMDWGQNVIWAARDNGRDINRRDAQAHCRAMGSGWSLPSVAQLQSLYARDTPHGLRVRGTILGEAREYFLYPATNLIQFTGRWYWSAEAFGSSEGLERESPLWLPERGPPVRQHLPGVVCSPSLSMVG